MKKNAIITSLIVIAALVVMAIFVYRPATVGYCSSHLQSCTSNSDCCSPNVCKETLFGSQCVSPILFEIWAKCSDDACHACYAEAEPNMQNIHCIAKYQPFSIIFGSSPTPCDYYGLTVADVSKPFYSAKAECEGTQLPTCQYTAETCPVWGNVCNAGEYSCLAPNCLAVKKPCQITKCTDSNIGGICYSNCPADRVPASSNYDCGYKCCIPKPPVNCAYTVETCPDWGTTCDNGLLHCQAPNCNDLTKSCTEPPTPPIPITTTTIFIIVGVIFVLAAGIYLTRKKK